MVFNWCHFADTAACLNHTKFEYNCSTGYLLKPAVMIEDSGNEGFNPFTQAVLKNIVPVNLAIKVHVHVHVGMTSYFIFSCHCHMPYFDNRWCPVYFWQKNKLVAMHWLTCLVFRLTLLQTSFLLRRKRHRILFGSMSLSSSTRSALYLKPLFNCH